MAPAPAVTQSVLVYNRIAHNRRKTWLLVAVAIASIVPFVAGIGYSASRVVLTYFGHRTHIGTVQERRILDRIDGYPAEYRYQIRAEFVRRMAAGRQARERDEADDNRLRIQVMI